MSGQMNQPGVKSQGPFLTMFQGVYWNTASCYVHVLIFALVTFLSYGASDNSVMVLLTW